MSCDEALVDITDILAEAKLTPDEVASAIRAEIREKTLCSASVGMGLYNNNNINNNVTEGLENWFYLLLTKLVIEIRDLCIVKCVPLISGNLLCQLQT